MNLALAGWHGWLESCPTYHRGAGSALVRPYYNLACEFNPWLGCVREAADWYFSLTSMSLSLSDQ